MARSRSFLKKQIERKKKKKKKEKAEKKLERKNQPTSGALEDMLAYVDADGNLTTEPPSEEIENEPKDDKDKESGSK
jgi:hypothetical protein